MSWNSVIRQVASRMNAIKGVLVADSEPAYIAGTAASVDDASYNYSLITDACADAEMMVVQVIAQIPNHPWRDYLRKDVFTGEAGTGIQSGEVLYLKSGASVPDCVALGPIYATSTGNPPLREKPLHEILRRNRNAGNFYKLPVYYYRIVDNRLYHTVKTPDAVRADFYKYDRQTDTIAKINTVGDGPLFPDTCEPAYVAGACSLLLKEEEYAGQAQFYAQLFAGMLQQIAQGFGTADPIQLPAPVKGTEAA